MKAAVYHAPGDIRIENVPDPKIQQPTDAIVRVTHACICGSDLWFYRGIQDYQSGWRTGHEWMGIVEEVGSEVKTMKKGDRVLAPFAFSDGTCEFCNKGLQTSCVQGSFWAVENDGGQGEAVRAPFADGTLVVIPPAVENDKDLLKAILPLTDVMATGHHAAVSAGVSEGSTVAVVGDGAVGLCGVLAAARLGAERIITLGHHNDRLQLAQKFGATDLVSSRGEEAVAQVKEMTDGGAISVMECVGAKSSMSTAIAIARPGGTVGYVGVPHGSSQEFNLFGLFMSNVTLNGGVAPARAYIPELLQDTVAGKLNSAPVLDLSIGLDGILKGYEAMDKRNAVKVAIEL